MASTSGVVEKSPSSPPQQQSSPRVEKSAIEFQPFSTNFPPLFQKFIHGFELQQEAGFELQQEVSRILESKDLTPLQNEIEDYARINTLLTHFLRFYADSFAIKLGKILELHPPLQIRTEVVTLLHKTLSEGENNQMSYSTLIKLKTPIFTSLLLETEEILFRSLWKLMAAVSDGVYQRSFGILDNYSVSWDNDVLNFSILCLADKSSPLTIKKGILVLTEFPLDSAHHKMFWYSDGRFETIFRKVVGLAYSEDQELKDLAFEACQVMLPNLWNHIKEHIQEVSVSQLKCLNDFVMLDNVNLFRGEDYNIFFRFMIEVAGHAVDNELKYHAVKVIRDLYTKNTFAMKIVLKFKLEDTTMRRAVTVALNLMACVVDDPVRFNDIFHNIEFTEKFKLGQFLFNCLCEDGMDIFFFPTAIDMIATIYISHEHWEFRYSALFALSSIAEKNFNGMGMINQFQTAALLVLNSLDDSNDGVLWAAINAIKHFSRCKALVVQTGYDRTFLDRLVRIANAHRCPRVQLYAAVVIEHLETLRDPAPVGHLARVLDIMEGSLPRALI